MRFWSEAYKTRALWDDKSVFKQVLSNKYLLPSGLRYLSKLVDWVMSTNGLRKFILGLMFALPQKEFSAAGEGTPPVPHANRRTKKQGTKNKRK